MSILRFIIPEPFYFTKDVAGGASGDMCESTHDPIELDGAPKPVANGIYALKVTSAMPRVFYYQSRGSKFLGGLVIVHGDKSGSSK